MILSFIADFFRLVDKQLKHRINAGQVAVNNQVDFFHRQFGDVKSDWKEDDTRVTFADFAISEKIFAELRKSFPQDDYCSEESNPMDEALNLQARYAWMLDPIDGTNNYALGIPICAISLALLKNGTPVYGFLYDMSRKTLIKGGPGLGLYEGRSPAKVKTSPMDSQSLVGLHFPLRPSVYDRLQPLLTGHRLRSLGSGALNLTYAAVGRLDGAIDYKVKVWDLAAAHALLIAGGGEFHFLEESIFPLKQFHPQLPPAPFFAGSSSFCQYLKGILNRR